MDDRSDEGRTAQFSPNADDEDFDEIEGRAAELMARRAAQQSQRQAQQRDSTDEISPVTQFGSLDIEDDAEPQTDEITAGWAPTAAEQPVASDYEMPPDETAKLNSTRRMVLPPWQSYPPAIDPEIDGPPDGLLDEEEPSTDLDHLHSESPAPPPGWQPGLSLPEGDWPLWPPEFSPPPPPGWQGPPPWIAPPEQPPAQWLSHGDAKPRRSARRADHGMPPGLRIPPSLDEARVDNLDRYAPERGWRRALYKGTGGRVNPGPSRKDRERQLLLDQIRQPIAGDFRIAVLSLKGGVGKTTTTLGLGSALASVRTDRVIALDANPDRGTLAERVLDTSTTSTVRDLLRDPDIRRYADVRNHTRMSPSRLEVLASEQDPEVADVFGETDYRCTMDILRHYYNIILTDCGTGLMHSAMAGVLDLANAIVLVTSASIDSAHSASATLDWLAQHGHGALVREAHVVVTGPKPGSVELKVDKVVEHFGARCRSTHVIPFERHLAEGAHFDFELLKPATARAYLELAGAVSEKFSRQGQPYPVH
jgi:MinD-like ATPase involved in chromosome partitioning or flagellar assembly